MNSAVRPNDIPTWTFPRSWSELGKIAKEVVTPRERDDEVILDGSRGSLFKDAVAVTQFAGSGILYKNAGKKAQQQNEKFPPLADAAKVKLQDPLVLVPGWGTLPEKFDRLVDHVLSSGQNGDRAVYIKDGQAYTNGGCTEATAIAASDKVFVAVFETTLDAPDASAPQLEKAVGAIKAAQGEEKVDVVGYSMGGLAVRKMLDNGGTKVDQVALLGTANQGTRFATLAEYIINRDINWAMSLGGINAAHLPAMGWLKTWNPEKPETNPQLDSLNHNLDRQLANASDFLSVASRDISTLTKTWGGRTGGDGLVPATSAALPGIRTTLLDGKGNKHHGNLPHDKDVFATLTNYFGWTEVADSTPAPV